LTFKEFLTDGAQAAYLPSLEQIADNWSNWLKPEILEGINDETLYPRIVGSLESGELSDAVRLQIGTDLTSLAWWRGPAIPLDLRARIDSLTRSILTDVADALVLGPRGLPPSRLRRAHVLLVGALQDPGHSPSAAAIDYAAALARDSRIDRLEIVHSGTLSPAMLAYITDRLGGFPASRGVAMVSTQENQGFLADILSRGPCTFHVVCEPALSPVISVVSRLGPTVMFTCADAAPVQYADVYWFYHSADYMAPLWRGQGAPKVFIGNYVQSLSGPWRETLPPSRLSKSDIGLPDDALVIATVGNRLGIEMDEAYITGMELAVRERPDCVWMVVGGLPEELSSACKQVLGKRFLHIPYSRELDRLMTTVDVFANPFRAGGGRSAYIALGAGAAVLTLGDGDACTAIPEDVRAADPTDYFRRLEMLLDSRELLEAYKTYEADHFRLVCDQKAFLANLQKMVRLAGERYAARQGGARLSDTVFAPRGVLAAAI
jgi:hypothetical protein